MITLFKNSDYENLEVALARVAVDLNRLWASKLCFADPRTMNATVRNGHTCSPYEDQVRDIFRHHLSEELSNALVFEEDIADGEQAWAGGRYLLVDPIDATHNLLGGYPAFATTCALIVDGGSPLAGSTTSPDQPYISPREILVRFARRTWHGLATGAAV